MKKSLFAFIFALVTTIVFNAGHTYAQSTQAISAEVPFAFAVNNNTLPPGTYTIRSVSSNRAFWTIQNSKSEGLLMARNLFGNGDYDSVQLRFRRYGEQYFLAGFTTALYHVDLPASKSEKNLQKTWDHTAKYELITLQTVAQK
jgi:hypothetical protein